MPVLPYWFDSQTYGVRPEKRPMPPRTCSRVVRRQRVVEADARRPQHAARAPRRSRSRSVDTADRVRGRLVRERRNVGTHAVGQRQVRRADATGRRRRSPNWRTLNSRRLQRIAGQREAVVVRLRQALFEQVEVREPVAAEAVADEQVPELEELVVRAEGERVLALQQREVVGELDRRPDRARWPSRSSRGPARTWPELRSTVTMRERPLLDRAARRGGRGCAGR